MHVLVSGRRMEVSDKLRNLSEEKVARLDRIFEMEKAEVVFSREKNPRIAESERCEITLEGHGHHVRAKVHAADGFSAVDKAIAKIEPQLKKLKGRQMRLSHGSSHESLRTAATDEAPVSADGAVVGADDEHDEHAPPKIVKSKRFAMMPMTPEEASSRMDLLGHGFFFFTNIDTHRAAVVYRRDDGDVGLIDEAD